MSHNMLRNEYAANMALESAGRTDVSQAWQQAAPVRAAKVADKRPARALSATMLTVPLVMMMMMMVLSSAVTYAHVWGFI